jgi:hypothetical protein
MQRSRLHFPILYGLGDLCYFVRFIAEAHPGLLNSDEIQRLQALESEFYKRLFDDNPDFVDGEELSD